MLDRNYQEAARKAWDEHTAIVESIATCHKLLVWFTCGGGIDWNAIETEVFETFAARKESEGSLLKHVTISDNRYHFCNFVVESNRSASDVMYGYAFLKGMAGRFGVEIHYEKPE